MHMCLDRWRGQSNAACLVYHSDPGAMKTGEGTTHCCGAGPARLIRGNMAGLVPTQ